MSKTMLWLTVGMGLVVLVAAQSVPVPNFLDRAVIRHDGHQVTVVANDSLPLLQAIDALRLEYGWQVNWESAPSYSDFDLVDDTSPKWRIAHPTEAGVTRPAGGVFTATFPEPDTSDPGAERLAITRLLQRYNATDNPGRYVLRAEPNGQLAVIGEQVRDETGALRRISPVLDTPITLTRAERTVEETINLIFAALESATGKRIVFAELSHSLFINTHVNIGGERIKARELLEQAFASTQRPILYDLCYNADVPAYIISTSLAMKEESDGIGGHKLVPVDRVKP